LIAAKRMTGTTATRAPKATRESVSTLGQIGTEMFVQISILTALLRK
jgi:hypothetical protein